MVDMDALKAILRKARDKMSPYSKRLTEIFMRVKSNDNVRKILKNRKVALATSCSVIFLFAAVINASFLTGGPSYKKLNSFILSEDEIARVLSKESDINERLRGIVNEIQYGSKRDINRKLDEIAKIEDETADLLFMHYVAKFWEEGRVAATKENSVLQNACNTTTSSIYRFSPYTKDENHLSKLNEFYFAMEDAFPVTPDIQSSCTPSVSTSYTRQVGVEKAKKYLLDNEVNIINNAMNRASGKLALAINTEAMIPAITKIYQEDGSKIYDDDEVLAQLSQNPASEKLAFIFEDAMNVKNRRGTKNRYLRAKYLTENIKGAGKDALDNMVKTYVELAANTDQEQQLEYLVGLTKTLIKTKYAKENKRLIYLLQSVHQTIYNEFSNEEVKNIFQVNDLRTFTRINIPPVSRYDRRALGWRESVEFLVCCNILRKQNHLYEDALNKFPLFDDGQIIAAIYGGLIDSQYDIWYVPKGEELSNIKKIRTTQIRNVESPMLPNVDFEDQRFIDKLVKVVDFSQVCTEQKYEIFHEPGFILRQSGEFVEVRCMSHFGTTKEEWFAGCENGETGLPYLNVCNAVAGRFSAPDVSPTQVTPVDEQKTEGSKASKKVVELNSRSSEKAPTQIISHKENSQELSEQGTALARKGDYEAALVLFEKSLALNPQNVSALNNYALVLKITGRLDDSHEQYKKALSLNAESAVTHKNMALLYKKLAAREFEEYLRLMPEAKDADIIDDQIKLLK